MDKYFEVKQEDVITHQCPDFNRRWSYVVDE